MGSRVQTGGFQSIFFYNCFLHEHNKRQTGSLSWRGSQGGENSPASWSPKPRAIFAGNVDRVWLGRGRWTPRNAVFTGGGGAWEVFADEGKQHDVIRLRGQRLEPVSQNSCIQGFVGTRLKNPPGHG